MAKNQSAQSEMEVESIGLESFELDTSKVKLVDIKAEDIEKQATKKNADGSVGMTKIDENIKQSLEEQAKLFTSTLIGSDPHSPKFKQMSDLINNMGNSEVNKTSNLSNRMLERGSIKTMKDSKYGEADVVAKDLSNLRSVILSLDPSEQDKKWFSKTKFLGIKIPFAKKADQYFAEYKSAQGQIDDIIKSLNNGKDALMEDNCYIDEDREQMEELMQKLEQYVYMMKSIDALIEEKLPEIEATDKLKADNIKQEILFPVRRKVMGLVQHLAVCMNGYMSLQILKENNKSLIEGVNTACNTTVAGLKIAITVSQGLDRQKAVSDQVKSVNETTNKMILETSERIGRQGLEIHKQASESAIKVETLEKAFSNIFAAMDAMDNYRAQALPVMQKNIEALEKTVEKARNFTTERRNQRVAGFTEEVIQEAVTPTESRRNVDITEALNKPAPKRKV